MCHYAVPDLPCVHSGSSKNYSKLITLNIIRNVKAAFYFRHFLLFLKRILSCCCFFAIILLFFDVILSMCQCVDDRDDTGKKEMNCSSSAALFSFAFLTQ